MVDYVEVCPTDLIGASAEHIWPLLTDPARLDWVGVKLIEAPPRSLAAGDRLVFGLPGLRISWTILAVEPPHRLEFDVAVPLGINNHEIIVVSPIDADSCRVTFN
jgi:uncharacterized protein YndB with AHSA1/START domain